MDDHRSLMRRLVLADSVEKVFGCAV